MYLLLRIVNKRRQQQISKVTKWIISETIVRKSRCSFKNYRVFSLLFSFVNIQTWPPDFFIRSSSLLLIPFGRFQHNIYYYIHNMYLYYILHRVDGIDSPFFIIITIFFFSCISLAPIRTDYSSHKIHYTSSTVVLGTEWEKRSLVHLYNSALQRVYECVRSFCIGSPAGMESFSLAKVAPYSYIYIYIQTLARSLFVSSWTSRWGIAM